VKPRADDGRLRRALVEAANVGGQSMADLTVLASQHDPFRVDTPAGHRDGAWLAAASDDLGLGERPIHLRGLHYAVLGRTKPNGLPYKNDDEDWLWLSGVAGKAARWLGYIPFERIRDQRNTPPVVRVHSKPLPGAFLTAGVDVEIPSADDALPTADVDDFTGEQANKLVIFGEKSSLEDVLGPISTEFGADLYLPTGEISDTMLHQMGRVGAADGRPMVVLCFADCDPSGWQMSISISRKLQAFKALEFGDLDFEVHRIGLTPDQVREYGLPTTPLKDDEKEKRAEAWRAAMGVDQTEIDALASLRPELLRTLAINAVSPFFDRTLDARVLDAESEWRREAQDVVDSTLDLDQLDRMAREKLASLRTEIDQLNRGLSINPDDFDLPGIVVPTAIDRRAEATGRALVDSRWAFAEQCRRLKASKGYRE
jgi:hypothetical protein